MLLLFCRDRDAVKSNMVLIRSQIVQRASLVILLVWIIEILGSKLLAAAFISPKTTPSTRNHPSHHPEIMLSRFRPAAVALSTKCMYHLHRPTQSANISSSSTTLSMNFFRDIFRSLSVDGGAFNLQIDYEALPFPCPEIADMARQQHPNAKGAFVASPSMPHLYLGTFAGGCFW